MIAGQFLTRLILISSVLTVPIQVAIAKPSKCDAVMAYTGKPPISISIPAPTVENSAPQKMDPDQQQKLVSGFTDMMTKTKAASMTIGLADANGSIWSATDGLEQPEKLHYWASVGKSFTAVIIMQLIENDQLSLDDRLSQWIKNVPNGDLITIRMLLNHTSGLYSTNEDRKATKNGQKTLTLKENIKVLKKHGPLFCPGHYWRYSNTGYYFLGLIAEDVYGRPLAQIIQTQIIDKIGLPNTRTLSENIDNVAAPRPNDDQQSNLRSPGAAGPIAATSEDMIVFWRALLSGNLVKPATRDAMFSELYPMFDDGMYYGLGVMAIRLPQPDGQSKTWVGHAGGMPGIRAFVMIDPAAHDYSAVALTGDGPANAAAYQMLNIWQEIKAP